MLFTLTVLTSGFSLVVRQVEGVRSVLVTLYPQLFLQGSQLSMRSRSIEQLFSPSSACLSFSVEYCQLEYLTLIKASTTTARDLERGSLGTPLRLNSQLSHPSSFSMVILIGARALKAVPMDFLLSFLCQRSLKLRCFGSIHSQ